jgi:hypothetical protein
MVIDEKAGCSFNVPATLVDGRQRHKPATARRFSRCYFATLLGFGEHHLAHVDIP